MSIQLQLYEDNFKIVDIDAGLHFNLAFTINTIFWKCWLAFAIANHYGFVCLSTGTHTLWNMLVSVHSHYGQLFRAMLKPKHMLSYDIPTAWHHHKVLLIRFYSSAMANKPDNTTTTTVFVVQKSRPSPMSGFISCERRWFPVHFALYKDVR